MDPQWRHYALCFFFQAEDGIRDVAVTGVQTCALPILCQPIAICQNLSNLPRLQPKPKKGSESFARANKAVRPWMPSPLASFSPPAANRQSLRANRRLCLFAAGGLNDEIGRAHV